MVLVSQVQHKKSLNFANQQKAYVLRHKKKLTYDKIAGQVVNLENKPSSANCVRRALLRFSTKKGYSTYKYDKCGRKPWKLTPEVKKWLVKRLLALRTKCICTSTKLQAELAREKKIQVDDSAIRRALREAGYFWLPRCQKRKYNKEYRVKRLALVNKLLRMGKKLWTECVLASIDGSVLSRAPSDPVDRHNHCFHGISHMYRKKSEAAKPSLAGEDPFADQVPLDHSLPIWAGISPLGVQELVIHPTKKCQVDEWVAAVHSDKMKAMTKRLQPKAKRPFVLHCDGERFLTAKASKAAYKKVGVELLTIPRKSPDLNPIEKFWGWLKKELRMRDLADLQKKRKPLGQTAFKARVRSVLRAKRTQTVAGNFAKDLLRVCRAVKKAKGHAVRGG